MKGNVSLLHRVPHQVNIDMPRFVLESLDKTIESACHLSTAVRLSCADPYANPVKKDKVSN